MKIAQILLSPAIGGAEKSFLDLCNGLSGSQEVIALVPRGVDYADRFLPAVELFQLTSNPSRNNPFLAIEIGRILKHERVEILHAHSAKAAQVAHRLNRFLGIPFTATKRNARKGHIFNRIEHVIAISEGVAKTIRNRSATVIYNGIDLLPSISSGPASGPFLIGAYGRLDPVKGFDKLIRAVHTLGFDCRLELHGTGPQQQTLERLIDTLGLQDKVFLQGYTEDIAASMDSSHLVVVSSHSEGFCRVLVEAVYYAHALLSTRVGIAEQLLSEDFLVEGDRIGEKITEIHDRYQEFREKFDPIKEAARGLFTVERMVDEHLAYYQTLI